MARKYEEHSSAEDLPDDASKHYADSGSESDSETDSGPTQPSLPSLAKSTIKSTDSTPPKPKPGVRSGQLKKEEADEKKAVTRRAPFERFWSHEDEIAILRGMIDYQNKKGTDPFSDIRDFHGFVGQSLHVPATHRQFSDKMFKLKKKYYTNLLMQKNKNEEVLSKPHDLECMQLAKKMWGAGSIEVRNVVDANLKSREAVSASGGDGRDITLTTSAKRVRCEKKEVSVKKNGGNEGDLLKQKRTSNEEAKEGNLQKQKKEKRNLNEEVNGQEKGTGGKKEEEEIVNEELIYGKGETLKNGKKRRTWVINDEILDAEAKKYPCLVSSIEATDLSKDVKQTVRAVLLGMVREERLIELEKEWMSLMQDKLELFIKEKHLISRQNEYALKCQRH